MIDWNLYSARVQARMESAYALRVVTRDIEDPLTGDLDGAEVHVDHLLGGEEKLFLLVHLFGHTVQWNVNPEAHEYGQLREAPVEESLLAGLILYEKEAAGYGLALLRECGINDLDQWFTDFSACDAEYLAHYYRTGEKREFKSFWQEGTTLLDLRPVPAFVPVARGRRRDGLVI